MAKVTSWFQRDAADRRRMTAEGFGTVEVECSMVELPGSMKLARQTCCTGFEGDIPSAPNHCQLYLKLRGAEVGLMTGAWIVRNPDGFT